MGIARLYRLTEATRLDKQVSQAEAERRYPESTIYFDRDVGDAHATFYVTKLDGGPDALVANTRGHGWWRFDHGSGQDYEPRWVKIDKPAKERGVKHANREKDTADARYKRRERRPEEWDNSMCPDCGYYGSGHYPEECPNCSPWAVNDEDET